MKGSQEIKFFFFRKLSNHAQSDIFTSTFRVRSYSYSTARVESASTEYRTNNKK